jgi:hypothetical protein
MFPPAIASPIGSRSSIVFERNRPGIGPRAALGCLGQDEFEVLPLQISGYRSRPACARLVGPRNSPLTMQVERDFEGPRSKRICKLPFQEPSRRDVICSCP